MNSPITGRPMPIIRENRTLNYRKEEFNVVYHYYKCSDSGEQFTDDNLDALNTVQVTNQYREKYGIPFPEEITQIRNQYGVSASKMSEILGLGANTYRLYEAGEMPTVANGRLIRAVREPDEFIRQVKASSFVLSEREVTKLIDRAKAIISTRSRSNGLTNASRIVLRDVGPSSLSGYRRFSLSRTAQVIAYFGEHIGDLFKTKLNKLLFYADFLAYKRQGRSITGLSYRAIPFGPVPAEYELLFLKLQDEGQLTVDECLVRDDQIIDVYRHLSVFESSEFSAEELRVLETIAGVFKGKTTKFISDISHEEQAWKDNHQGKQLIDYQRYAFEVGSFLSELSGDPDG